MRKKSSGTRNIWPFRSLTTMMDTAKCSSEKLQSVSARVCKISLNLSAASDEFAIRSMNQNFSPVSGPLSLPCTFL